MNVETGRRSVPSSIRRGRHRNCTQWLLLIVDDEPAILAALERNLRKTHEVSTAVTARAAIARLQSGERFDHVLCDLQMPNINGMEFYEAVKAIDAPLAERIVFMTGGSLTAAASEFFSRVTNTRIEKPFDLAALRACLLPVSTR